MTVSLVVLHPLLSFLFFIIHCEFDQGTRFQNIDNNRSIDQMTGCLFGPIFTEMILVLLKKSHWQAASFVHALAVPKNKTPTLKVKANRGVQSQNKKPAGLQRQRAEGYSTGLSPHLISHHDSCCQRSKGICLPSSPSDPVWLFGDIREIHEHNEAQDIMDAWEPGRNIHFWFYSTVDVSHNKGRLHHRGEIYVNDVIMQYKFLFPLWKGRPQRQWDTVQQHGPRYLTWQSVLPASLSISVIWWCEQ